MEILATTLPELTARFKKDFGKGAYHADALFREVFKSGNSQFKSAKEFLNSPAFTKAIETKIKMSPGAVIERFEEGHLTKFITKLADGEKIESVIVPMTRHKTLCVSSQIGCRMGCRFCQTAKIGFARNLSAHEIVGQLYNARFVLKENIKNIVFMGMGEPLDNFDAVIRAMKVMNAQKGFDVAFRHMTLSTSGLANQIEKLGTLGLTGLRLAVSINSSDNDKRSFLMPVNRRIPLETLKKTLVQFPLPKRGCFLFEYILIKGLNDGKKDAISLAKYINPLPVRLNLIPYNCVDGFNYASPDDDDINRFAQKLTDLGVFVVKRWSKGRSLGAGCGQLGAGRANPDDRVLSAGV